MENQFKSSSYVTIGQLFDQAVERVMNDQSFRRTMETRNNKYTWYIGKQVGYFILHTSYAIYTYLSYISSTAYHQASKAEKKEED